MRTIILLGLLLVLAFGCIGEQAPAQKAAPVPDKISTQAQADAQEKALADEIRGMENFSISG